MGSSSSSDFTETASATSEDDFFFSYSEGVWEVALGEGRVGALMARGDVEVEVF